MKQEQDEKSPDLELQLLCKMENRFTGRCLKETRFKIEDTSPVRNKEKDFPDLHIQLLGGKQILKKRPQGRPYFAPYPQILHFLEGIVANRKDNRNTIEVISSTKMLQDKKFKEQEKVKDREAKRKREKEGKDLEATKIPFKYMCRIYPPACNKIYSYHL